MCYYLILISTENNFWKITFKMWPFSFKMKKPSILLTSLVINWIVWPIWWIKWIAAIHSRYHCNYRILVSLDHFILSKWRLQMMLNTGKTFGVSVFTFYSLYREIINHGRMFDPSVILRLSWTMIYMIGTLLVIYVSAQVTNEVRVKVLNWIERKLSLYLLIFTGENDIANTAWHKKSL